MPDRLDISWSRPSLDAATQRFQTNDGGKIDYIEMRVSGENIVALALASNELTRESFSAGVRYIVGGKKAWRARVSLDHACPFPSSPPTSRINHHALSCGMEYTRGLRIQRKPDKYDNWGLFRHPRHQKQRLPPSMSGQPEPEIDLTHEYSQSFPFLLLLKPMWKYFGRTTMCGLAEEDRYQERDVVIFVFGVWSNFKISSATVGHKCATPCISCNFREPRAVNTNFSVAVK